MTQPTTRFDSRGGAFIWGENGGQVAFAVESTRCALLDARSYFGPTTWDGHKELGPERQFHPTILLPHNEQAIAHPALHLLLNLQKTTWISEPACIGSAVRQIERASGPRTLAKARIQGSTGNGAA